MTSKTNHNLLDKEDLSTDSGVRQNFAEEMALRPAPLPSASPILKYAKWGERLMQRLDLVSSRQNEEIRKQRRLISVKADIKKAVSRKNDAHPIDLGLN